MGRKIRMGKKRHHRSNGFTLIEVLTAMMILAVSFVVLLQLFSGGLRTGRLTDDYTRAILHAREKMEEILLFEKSGSDEQEGEFEDGFKWKTEIVRVENTEAEAAKMSLNSFNVKVEVTWFEGSRKKHFEINSLKISVTEQY
ncbi:MAG: prepilin-type N-terminal cleavage/methylation domain-containing protein [Desulfobacterales bacterium]|nr:prepilin-type N-terminal cleavage/methylation domain-containing protein [Desulfobacterales bacterium]